MDETIEILEKHPHSKEQQNDGASCSTASSVVASSWVFPRKKPRSRSRGRRRKDEDEDEEEDEERFCFGATVGMYFRS